MEREIGLLLMCFLSPFIVLVFQQLEAGGWSVTLYSAVALLTRLSQCYPGVKKPLNIFIDVTECDLFW